MPFFFEAFVEKINTVNIDNLTEEELAEFIKFLFFSKKMRDDLTYIYLNFNRVEQGKRAKKELKVSGDETVPFRIALIAVYFKDNQEAGKAFLKNVEKTLKKLEQLEKAFGKRGKFLPGVNEHGEENYERLAYQYELLHYQDAMNFANKVNYSFDPEKYSDILSMMSFLKTVDNSREEIASRFRLENTPASSHILSLLENYEEEKINKILQTDLREKYNFYALGEATLINTVRSSFKSVGRTLFNKHAQRENQIDLIQKVFNSLQESGFDAEKKATHAYVILLKVQKQLGKEHNVFSSGMNTLCVQLKKELKSALPLEKINKLEKNKTEYKNTLKEVLEEIETKRVKSRKKF